MHIDTESYSTPSSSVQDELHLGQTVWMFRPSIKLLYDSQASVQKAEQDRKLEVANQFDF